MLQDIELLLNSNPQKALVEIEKHFPTEDLHTNILKADCLRICECYDEALSIYQKYALLGGNHTYVLWQRSYECCILKKDFNKALLILNKAISVFSEDLYFHANAAHLLFEGNKPKKALCHARHIFEKSDDDRLLCVSEDVYRFSTLSKQAYEVVKKRQSVSTIPDFFYGVLLCSAQGICNWDEVEKYSSILDKKYLLGDYKSSMEIALYNIARTQNEEININVAKANTELSEKIESYFSINKFKNNKIRIGFLSADFHEHPVSYLIVGLLENINKENFEIYIFDDSNSNNKNERINKVSNGYLCVGGQSDLEIATKINNLNIDILIDLMGLTTKNRLGVFALRPSTINVGFLGFAGSCGSSKIDYIITDKIITPDSSKPFYSEKLCRLPECFMPNDNKRTISKSSITRKDLGLPEDAIVFCSFNRPFKIDHQTINLWMRIIKKVPNSILWQKTEDEEVQKSIINIAKKYNVEDRIVFAKNTHSPDAHLFRSTFADLALDTLTYNGHTITTDMLWAGVPVITCMGKHFASRVSASLLNAIGLNDCVAESIEEMEKKAVDIATNKNKLKEIKKRLDENKFIMPLFDTERYTRHFEIAMNTILENKDHVDILPLPSRNNRFIENNSEIIKEENLRIENIKTNEYSVNFDFCPICEFLEKDSTARFVISGQHPKCEIENKKYWLFCSNCGHFYSNSFFDNLGKSKFENSIFNENKEFSNFDYLINKIKSYGVNKWVVANPKDIDFLCTLRTFQKNTKVITNLEDICNKIKKENFECYKDNIITSNLEFDALSLFSFEDFPFPEIILSKIYSVMSGQSVLHLPIYEFNYENIVEYQEIFEPFRIHMYSEKTINDLINKNNFIIKEKIADSKNSIIKHYILKK